MKKERSKVVIAPKQWKVLEHFISEESKQIEKYLNLRWQNPTEEFSHFKTYPGKIEKSMEDMTRVTASKACKIFLEMEIFEELEKETGVHLKGSDVRPYTIKSDLKTLRTVIKLMFENLTYPDVLILLDNYYFTYNINDSLVKEVLAEKGVTISRPFSIMDFDIKNAQRLLDIDARNNAKSGDNSQQSENAFLIMQSMINGLEGRIKKDERSYISQLVNTCTYFLEAVDSSNVFFGENLHYFENRLFRLVDSVYSNGSNYHLNNELYIGSSFSWTPLKLPVFTNVSTEDGRIDEIKHINTKYFYDLLYAEQALSFSDLVSRVLNADDRILDRLTASGKNPQMLDYRQREYFAGEIMKFRKKWEDKIELNKEEFDPSISSDVFKDIKSQQAFVAHELRMLKGNPDIDDSIDKLIKSVDESYDEMYALVERYSKLKEITSDFVVNNFGTLIDEHYTKFEYERLVIPILALIHASPLALNEFINGEWDSFDLSFDFGEQPGNCELISKLMRIASINLLTCPRILTKGIILSASMEHFTLPEYKRSFSEYQSLLDPKEYLRFFDLKTDEWYNNLTYTEFKSSEPSFLKIKLKQIYELKYMLNFQTSCDEPGGPMVSRMELKVNSDFDIHLLKASDIKDPILLISNLKSNHYKSEHVRKMFSKRMQNKILVINTDTQPSIHFLKELVGELNAVILNPKFFNDTLFNDVIDLNEELRVELKRRLSHRLSNLEILRLVNEKQLLNIYFLEGNRYVLEKIFKDEFESDFTEEYEESLVKFIAVKSQLVTR